MKPTRCTVCIGSDCLDSDGVYGDGTLKRDLTVADATTYQQEIDAGVWCAPWTAWQDSKICTSDFGCCICCVPCAITSLLWCLTVPVPYFCCCRRPTLQEIVAARAAEELAVESAAPAVTDVAPSKQPPSPPFYADPPLDADPMPPPYLE